MANLGDFDFRDLKKIQKQLRQLQTDFPGFLEECIREIAARLFAKVVARTPVGETGDLRRGWTIGAIRQTQAGYEVEIINPVEYSLYREYGHRTANHKGWVEGSFMLTISEEEIKQEMPTIMERKFKQWIDGHMR